VVCDDNARWLHGYLDGELDLVRSLEIEEHLKTCPDCAQYLRSQQTLRKAFRSSALYERAPKGLDARIRAAVAQAAGEAGAQAQGSAPAEDAATHRRVVAIRPPARRAALNWLAVAAAVLLAAALAWRMLPGEGRPSPDQLLAQEVVASHIRSLQPGHLMDVQSTDQHTVKPWFNGKVDFSPSVKDFAQDGFPLVGGRLDYVRRRDVAALVYQRRQHLINLYEWPDESAVDKPVRSTSLQGYNMLVWQRGGMYYSAVSDLNPSELRQFSQLLQQ
jgi:anti-sigma factor RsiW